MAHTPLPTNFVVDDPVRASWMNQVGQADVDFQDRVSDLEESADDHEDRLDLLEGTGPSGQRLFISTTTLTDAQIKALPTTGIALVAAPGASKRIKVHSATYYSWFQNGTYTNINTNAWMVIGVESGWLAGIIANEAAVSLTKLTTFLQSATPLCVDTPPYIEDDGNGWVQAAVTGTTALTENKRLEIALNNQGSGNLTGGHVSNTLTVVVYYSIEAVPAYYMPFTLNNSEQQRPKQRRPKRPAGNFNQGLQL